MARKTNQIRRALLEAVFWRANSPVARIARRFEVTREAVRLHMRQLVKGGHVKSEGKGRWCRYKLVPTLQVKREFELTEKLTEDQVWETFVRPKLGETTKEENEICHYGLTEMANNVIDHAAARKLTVVIQRTAVSVTIIVTDDGVGMFQKIAAALGLTDPRQALLELSKGKFTTDPSRHTGEGVFFTSRAFDRFSIRSSDLLFFHTSISDDWLVESEEKTFTGTRITMSLIVPTDRKLEDVFARFSSGPEDHRFAKTHVPLKLATYGDESLVSRSSAKRVLSRVERFDEVLLDFARVRSIGQAFADEIFRVFANAHPAVQLTAINANEQVTSMIRRADAAKKDRDQAR